MMSDELIRVLSKKASQSQCKFKVSAIGLNGKGELVSKAMNKCRFSRKGGGMHAEMEIMKSARRKGVKSIIVCRTGKCGTPLPIHPCAVCSNKAMDLGIKIITVGSCKYTAKKRYKNNG